MSVGRLDGRSGEHRPDPAAPLLIVVSDGTADQLRALAEVRWTGPVVMVASPAEAQEVLAVGPPVVEPVAVLPRAAPLPPLDLDPDRQVVVCRGREVHLTPLEFGLLAALLEAPGRVRRFGELVAEVWGTHAVSDVTHVHSTVKRLRRKLDTVSAPVDIEAVRGIGFRLVRQRPLTSVGL